MVAFMLGYRSLQLVCTFLCLRADHQTPELALLHRILQENNNFPTQPGQPSVRLSTPGGRQVSLSLHKSSPEGALAVSIHTSSVELMCQLRMAVCDIVQV